MNILKQETIRGAFHNRLMELGFLYVNQNGYYGRNANPRYFLKGTQGANLVMIMTVSDYEPYSHFGSANSDSYQQHLEVNTLKTTIFVDTAKEELLLTTRRRFLTDKRHSRQLHKDMLDLGLTPAKSGGKVYYYAKIGGLYVKMYFTITTSDYSRDQVKEREPQEMVHSFFGGTQRPNSDRYKNY